jgi:hypothetical protein
VDSRGTREASRVDPQLANLTVPTDRSASVVPTDRSGFRSVNPMGHHPATVLHIAFDRNSHQICWDGGPMSQDTSGGSGLLREKRRFMLRYSDFYVTQKERVPEPSRVARTTRRGEST